MNQIDITTLPDSQLLRLALWDVMRFVEAGGMLEMGIWYSEVLAVAPCVACMAGAVMTQSVFPHQMPEDLMTVKARLHMGESPDDAFVSDPDIGEAIYRIDLIRCGEIRDRLGLMASDAFGFCPEWENDTNENIAAYLAYADHLQSIEEASA